MSKRITISDEEYFKLLELKAKLKTDCLLDILAKVDTGQLTNMPMVQITNNPIKPNSPETKQPLCRCGHPESYHSADGCLGDGAMCECKQFNQTV